MMSTKMRQVTREDFEVLTKYHPGEIRYYVDVDKALASKRKPTRVTIKRPTKKVAKKTAKKKPVQRNTGTAINAMSGRRNNAPLQLGLASPSFKANSKSESQWRLVKLQLHNDPTRVIGRTDLVSTIVSGSVYNATQIGPFVSDCLKKGYLRYKQETAAAA